MPKMSENKKVEAIKASSQLVCITGFMGSGKSQVMTFLQEMGYKIFLADEYVHQIYQKNEVGYETIKNNFGTEFVNDNEVDRNKLKELILSDVAQKKLLEKLLNKLIYQKINELKRTNQLIFVELATYLFFESYFADLFGKVIVVDAKNQNFKKNEFKKFSSIQKFLTKTVGNSKNATHNGVFWADYIVENVGSLVELKGAVKKMLAFLKG
ncbi:MAG: dephospho-CoA kinase [Malacoplasma sp.]|nr:dephospho-CoA kinase [Malacoplasma sp.]